MGGRRLRIGIDAHAIGKRQTGNERYMRYVILGLREICDHELVLYFSRPEAAAAWPADDRTEVRVMRPDHFSSRLLWYLPIGSRRDRLDALIAQYVGPPSAACPVVPIVHDVAFAVYPEYYSRFDRMWMRTLIPAGMRRAARVLTVSEFSRSEIQRVYGVPTTKIDIAPAAVDPMFRDPTPRRGPVEPPFFLTIANLQPRKNLPTLLRGYREVLRRDPAIRERLVIVGQPFFRTQAIEREADDLVRAGRVVFTGYLSDEALIGLLQNATAFAYPSVYEGFGSPVIEAMATGVPTLVSDVPVMREVAGDVALRSTPDDPRAWADTLARVAAQPDLRAELGARGRVWTERYTPDRSAAATLRSVELAVVSARRSGSIGH